MNITVEDGHGNVLEQTIDNGDGTGTHTTYDPSGKVTSVEHLTGLPIEDPPPPSTEDRITALEDAITNASSLNDLKARVRAASDSERALR